MAQENHNADFVVTVGDEQMLIQNQSPLDKEAEIAKLRAYADGIADATGNK